MGGLLGSFLTFDTTGLDFALTALFVVLFLEQWKKPENRPAGVMGILCAAASLAVFGADNMVIPAMVLVLAVLLGARRRLDRSGEEGTCDTDAFTDAGYYPGGGRWDPADPMAALWLFPEKKNSPRCSGIPGGKSFRPP